MSAKDSTYKKTLIDHGNYGETYKIEFNGKTYAIKSFYVNLQDYKSEEIKEIRNLIGKLTKINFMSILRIYNFSPDGFDGDTRPAILTDYCPNGSLADNLDSLDSTEKLINLYGIATAMKFLHQINILHYELKIENVLLDEEKHPKLKDIGFSKVFRSLTTMSRQHGTSPYLAPEIFTDSEYNKKSEVYSFGLMMYEILTGKRIFQDLSNTEIMLNTVNGVRPTIPSNVPEGLKQLIEKCWDVDPEKRPTFDEITSIIANII